MKQTMNEMPREKRKYVRKKPYTVKRTKVELYNGHIIRMERIDRLCVTKYTVDEEKKIFATKREAKDFIDVKECHTSPNFFIRIHKLINKCR